MKYAALCIALLAGSARADSDRTLHLAVHGTIDPDVLRGKLADELGATVELAGETCDAPCLDITIDSKRVAKVTFASRSGSSRERTIQLDTNTTHWPLVVTLLAGNVVRDEAADVLALLPSRELPAGPPPPPEPPAPEPDEAPPAVAPVVVVAPPPPPVAAPAPPPPPEVAHSFIGFGLVPVLSTDLTNVGTVRHFLSLHAIVGVSGGSSGATVSGVADIECGPVAGFQIGGVAAVADKVSGTQIGGVAAVADDLDGVQIGGTAAVADRVFGFQIGGVAAVVDRADTQIAGVAAVADGPTSWQVAGVASTASSSHVQISGVSSVSNGDANIQIAGVVNVADRVRGLQIAPINVASTVEGVQIGVINVGGSPDSNSFGLINIVPGGRYDLEAAIDSSKLGTLTFRHGGNNWHNVYGIGGHPVNRSDSMTSGNDDIWMYGLGFGPSFHFGDTRIDLEAIAWQVNHGPRHESDISLLTQARLSISHGFGPFGLVFGAAYNGYISSDNASPLILERTTTGSPMKSGVTYTDWPSVFVGVRI